MTMTNQEIFTKAWNHGKTMRNMAKAYNKVQCYYRALNGEKCLIGSFIPDDKYVSEMEGDVIDLLCSKTFRPIFNEIGLTSPHPSGDKFLTEVEAKFLGKLQRCHDDAESLDEMFLNLRDFATEFNLTIPE